MTLTSAGARPSCTACAPRVSGGFRPSSKREVDPAAAVGGDRLDHRFRLCRRETVVAKQFHHLGPLPLRRLLGLAQLALRRVVVSIGARSEIAAEPHGDRPGGDFCQTGDHDHAGRGYRARQPRGQCERHGQPVRPADHDVAHRLVPPTITSGGLTLNAVIPQGGGNVPIAGGQALIAYEVVDADPLQVDDVVIPL